MNETACVMLVMTAVSVISKHRPRAMRGSSTSDRQSMMAQLDMPSMVFTLLVLLLFIKESLGPRWPALSWC